MLSRALRLVCVFSVTVLLVSAPIGCDDSSNKPNEVTKPAPEITKANNAMEEFMKKGGNAPAAAPAKK